MRNLPADPALLSRAAIAAGLLIFLAAAALALFAQPAQGQESAEPTATPTPERREGYEERLAARIERYQAARAAKEGASGTASTGLKTGVQSGCTVPKTGSQGNQVMFVTKDDIDFFIGCHVEKVAGCYSYDTIMLLDEPLNFDWYDSYLGLGGTYLHAVIVHEAGHAYGVNHSDTQLAVMHGDFVRANPEDLDVVAMMAHYQSR